MGGVSVDIIYGDVRQETSFTPAVSSLESHEEVFHEILYTCRRYVSVARRRIKEHFARTRTCTVGTRASNAVVPGTGVPARVHLFFSLFVYKDFAKKKRSSTFFSRLRETLPATGARQPDGTPTTTTGTVRSLPVPVASAWDTGRGHDRTDGLFSGTREKEQGGVVFLARL